MKHFWSLSPILLFALIFSLSQTNIQSRITEQASETEFAVSDTIIQYTAEVRAIIDAKCYDCHSDKGEDEEAKEELLWDELPNLSNMDKLYSMDAIIESVEEGEMPPEDYLKKHPEAALTTEEAKLIIDWADAIASKLME